MQSLIHMPVKENIGLYYIHELMDYQARLRARWLSLEVEVQ